MGLGAGGEDRGDALGQEVTVHIGREGSLAQAFVGGQLQDLLGARSSFSAVAAPVGKPLITAATAGLAATLSTLSLSSGMGSAGAIIIAGSGLPPRTARGRPGDDVTGDKAVRDLIGISKPNHQ